MLSCQQLFAWGLALLLLATPVAAQSTEVDPIEDAFDSIMATYTRIDWIDPLNPHYVNLGNDQFLVEIAGGIKVWDVPSNTFSPLKFASSLSDVKVKQLYGTQSWARLGSAPAGTVLVGVGSPILLWWDGTRREISSALPISESRNLPALLALDSHHVLLCWRNVGSKVVRLNQTWNTSQLELAEPGNSEVQDALKLTGVAGSVAGFTALSENDIRRPVFYDADRCKWEVKHPPQNIREFIDKKTRQQEPKVKPYFLSDGRILVSELSYFKTDHLSKAGGRWVDLNPPLLWQPETDSWVAIEHTNGDGGQIHRAGQQEPVLSYAFQSKTIEFLDTLTMRWVRSRQRLPDGYGANIEPLSNGNALVLMRESHPAYRGIAGMVAPERNSIPAGRLATSRYRYDGEIAMPGGGLMFVGDGERWQPSTRSEVINAAEGKVRQIASLPIPLVSPYGLALKDGSVLVFGGLPARCAPDSYMFESDPCSRLPAQASYRYFPREDRWQDLPHLAIPFTHGYWWETGNSELVTQWARNDALARLKGEVVWIEGGKSFGNEEERNLPQTSHLKRWHFDLPNSAAANVARLRKARAQATLIELADGRLAVMGGDAQLERVALEKGCFDCPDEFVSIGPFRDARTTEILDESDAANPSWTTGPTAHYGGGRAVKLANNRVFKLSRIGVFDEYGYRAEIADAAFTRWEKLPPFPLRSAIVRNLSVVGNRVVILTNKAQTVVWDDDNNRWQSWSSWPRGAGTETDPPISLRGTEGDRNVLVRYASFFEVVPLPDYVNQR